MPSREGRGAYGHGRKLSREVLDNYNPLGLKIVPFPEEKVCGWCQSKKEVVFPIAPRLCERCVQRINGRQDILKNFKPKIDLMGYRCDGCGTVTYMPVITNTRICNACTILLGKQVQKNQANLAYGARRVFG